MLIFFFRGMFMGDQRWSSHAAHCRVASTIILTICCVRALSCRWHHPEYRAGESHVSRIPPAGKPTKMICRHHRLYKDAWYAYSYDWRQLPGTADSLECRCVVVFQNVFRDIVYLYKPSTVGIGHHILFLLIYVTHLSRQPRGSVITLYFCSFSLYLGLGHGDQHILFLLIFRDISRPSTMGIGHHILFLLIFVIYYT